jgi:hypothetical protein
MALKKSQKSLKNWTSQEWGTKSGKKSAETGERYLPKSAIASLSPQEYAATSKKKREDTKKGKQHSKQPKKIAKKTASHRAEGGLMSANDGLIHPENKEFLENFHNEVISSGSELVEDGMTTTMRITGIGIKGKEYLLPSYDPETKRILDPKETAEKFMPLIDSGVIEGYDSPEEAEEDRKKFYDDIVEGKNEFKNKNEGKNMKKPEELYHGGMMSDCKGVMSAPEIIIGVDPVSGNDIPLGSKAENVRDDMPAMLSEGEYVLPADVVKWHGLKHIQGMHDEASMGLMGMAVEGYLGSELEEEPEKKKESKKDKKTPEGIKVEVAEVKTENKAKKLEKEESEYAKGLAEGGFPDLNKDGKITQADILKGRGVFYGGGLMQYDEGGLSLDDSADEAFDAYQQMINDPDYKRKQELQERYDREEDLTEDEVKELSSLSAPEKDSSDIAEEVTSKADGMIETEEQRELDELVNSLMSQSSNFSGQDEYTAFTEGLMSGLKASESNLGDKLAEVELKFGDKTYTPFSFLNKD